MTNNKVFVDTSAFYALMDRSDKNHAEAASLWTSLIENKTSLLTTSYVVIETVALLQNRLGFEAASLWYQDILGIVEVWWIDESLHRSAFELWFGLSQRQLSLVDCASFVTMRRYQGAKTFCFDRHFAAQGFDVISV